MLQVCVLASGSSGNCVYVGSSQTRILIDAGISGKLTAERLHGVGVEPEAIDAICLTHAHADHHASLSVLHRRMDAALYANGGTLEALSGNRKLAGLAWNIFSTGHPFVIGDLRLDPFRVPHDCYDPVGFVISCGDERVGVVTDIGMATELVRQRLSSCHVLVLEANHDEAMLKDSNRPWSLKQRIAGRQGHLSNAKAGELIKEVAGDTLQTVFLAHLSRDCNEPGLARDTVRNMLDASSMEHIAVKLTYASRASEMVTVGK
jgi:phosphoribosyl 1,2-cyclic phosphodiesterase